MLGGGHGVDLAPPAVPAAAAWTPPPAATGPRVDAASGLEAASRLDAASTPLDATSQCPRLDDDRTLSLAIVEPPVEHVQHDEQLEVIDWDTLAIVGADDGEGRVEIFDDDQMYELLGLRAEDEANKSDHAPVGDDNEDNEETIGAAIPVDDDIPGERVILHDPDKPCMDIGTVYPDMHDFRLAIRQFAINEEFELVTTKSDTVRFISDCKGKDCPWHIVGRRQPDGKTVMVTVLIGKHNCTSSARRKTTTPTSAWVASKAIHHLKINASMGPKELRSRLEEKHKCKIPYDTIWKGRQLALKELHGCWEESFQMLFNWKAEVLNRMPGSVIEIDVKEEDGKVCFHRWNRHMAAATGIDGHNWMYPVVFGFIDGETEDNWVWFMNQLKKAIGDLSLLAVCTDACKGLENAVKLVFPQAEQRECFRHLMQNFVKRFGDWKDLPVVELTDKVRELIMTLWHKRRIGDKLHGKILPAVIQQLKHIGKPCQHALALITAQESVDVQLEDFVHEYYSVQRKRKPRKNTTKYGENPKVPSSRKRAKKGAAAVHGSEEAAAVQETDPSLLVQSPAKPTKNRLYRTAQSLACYVVGRRYNLNGQYLIITNRHKENGS
ncbi:hypothetical protein U9M48_035187 [Paspalum notatum var. saurae]|uniref:Transposase n=1 Tax=Paspalum notatum var. saurae TaxID=547442 RepID=A0AAQ3UEQ5_PASNO